MCPPHQPSAYWHSVLIAIKQDCNVARQHERIARELRCCKRFLQEVCFSMIHMCTWTHLHVRMHTAHAHTHTHTHNTQHTYRDTHTDTHTHTQTHTHAHVFLICSAFVAHSIYPLSCHFAPYCAPLLHTPWTECFAIAGRVQAATAGKCKEGRA